MSEKNRYFIELAYNGKKYHGWQVQPNAISIQEVLNSKISTLLREEIYVVGSGRTDTGVHSKQQFAHFDTLTLLKEADFQHKLNSFLPNDISIQNVRKVKAEAHTRFDATFRRYEYHISMHKNPFLIDYAWQIFQKVDFDKMNKAASYLLEQKSFESFCKTHTQNDHFLCDVTRAEWEVVDNTNAIFHIQANRFLRGMVRLIVGELIKVGMGKKTIEIFKKETDSRSFNNNRISAPAQGLFLCEVGYPEEIFVN